MTVLHWFQELRSGFGDQFFTICTFVGTQAVLILLFCINYWCIDKNFACEIGSSFFSSSLLVQNLKVTLRIPRPFVRDTTLIPVDSALKGATGYSFPSGHTQTAASTLVPAVYEYRRHKVISVLMCILILLTGISRMYLGVHTPYDVGAALGISLLCALAVMILRRRLSESTWYNIILTVIGAVSVFSVIYAVILNSAGDIESDQLKDCFKSAGAAAGFSLGVFLERKYAGFAPSAGDTKQKSIRAAAGFLTTGILYALKLILPDCLIIALMRYFLLTFWITFVYPLIYTKLSAQKSQA